MSDAHGHNVVNPLFTIYGCFDTTAAAHCQEGQRCATTATTPSTNSGARATGSGSPRKSRRPSPAQRKAELEALHKAERAAGPRVMREILESEKAVQREAEKPEGE